MNGTDCTNIGETPHSTLNGSNRIGHDTIDSGYLSLTPHSVSTYTPIVAGCRTRLSCSKRHHRNRLDPLQSDRVLRHRSKLNHLLNASESDYLLSSENNSICSSRGDSAVSLCSEQASFSLSHSTSLGIAEHSTEFREVRGRTRRSCRTTVPITPSSTRLQLLSPPPSPAVPSSSFIASEPIDEDVEMKLVIVPQSTPQVSLSSPRHRTPPRIVLVSPNERKCSPRLTSVDAKKLSKLSITDLAVIADIKPKRLDFSHRAITVKAWHRRRATPDYTGREALDIMSLLGEKSNHWRIVAKILSYLAPQDLCSVSMVSHAWRRICANDSRANTRRLSHVILRQRSKENLKLIGKAKLESDVPSSPRSRFVRKGFLMEVQNLLQIPGGHQRPPSSPPVSPSKVKFHSFVKASRTLEPWEHLLPCPNCSFPCHVDGEKNVGTCSRQGCSMEFCTSCSSRPHTGPCKTPLLATPTKRTKRLVVGSRQSKRNLRRL